MYMYDFKWLFLFLTSSCCIAQAQNYEYWFDQQSQSQLVLNSNRQFQFSNVSGTINGVYAVENNIMTMQDTVGNIYQYRVQNYSTTQLVISDNKGVSYHFTAKHLNKTQKSLVNQNLLPWQNNIYSQIMAEKNGLKWTEKQNQIYNEFLQLLIGQAITIH